MTLLNTVVCPNCEAEDTRGTRFCRHCGASFSGDGTTPPAVSEPPAFSQPPALSQPPAAGEPLVHLLTEVAELQRELLRQFDKGRRAQAHQFERAIAAQTESLRATLEHHSRQTERLQGWQKWTAGLAAAVVLMVVIVVQFAS